MDVKVLEKAVAEYVEVPLLGQVFTLKAPTMGKAAKLQFTHGHKMDRAKEADAPSVFMECCLDTIELCLVEKVPRALLQKVVTRTGLVNSPLVTEARVLCGQIAPGVEEDPDRDLPTSLPAA